MASQPATPADSDLYTDHEVYRMAQRIAGKQIDVVIVGPTGAGKDWVSRYIYRHSGCSGAFIAVNCAAIPETLAESEFFGVEAGAYTGAVKSRPGKIELADKGILYLDEIDSMPLSLQAKLLRAIQERGVERVGSSTFHASEFRVIAATKTPLAELVKQGKFRADLYYRLNVVELRLPLIRNQPERLLAMFWRYVELARITLGELPEPLNVAHIEAQLLAHDWEGNIRELKAVAERVCLGFPPFASDLNADTNSVGLCRSLNDLLKMVEEKIVHATMARCNRNVNQASVELGITPQVLYYKLAKLAKGSGQDWRGATT